MINFYVLSERLFLESEELSNARVGSVTKKKHGFSTHFSERYIKS